VVFPRLVWRSPWRLRSPPLSSCSVSSPRPCAAAVWDRLASITEQQSAETRDKSTVTGWSPSRLPGTSRSGSIHRRGFKALSSEDIWLSISAQASAGPMMPTASTSRSSASTPSRFGLYMGLMVSTMLTLRRLRKRWRNHPEHGYLSHYAEMTQLSLYPFLVCGAFIPFAYFDLYSCWWRLPPCSSCSPRRRSVGRCESVPQLKRSAIGAVRPSALPSRSPGGTHVDTFAMLQPSRVILSFAVRDIGALQADRARSRMVYSSAASP